MKFFKKTVSILMVVAMLFPNVTATYATAKKTQDTTDTTVEESVSSEYSVSAETVENGQVYINDQKDTIVTLEAGETVTVSLKADSGYDVATFYIKDADTGDIIASKETDDDIFKFTMPEMDIVVGGGFVSLASSNDASVKETSFDHYYSDIDESLVNTSDLFIQTADDSIFTEDTNIVSSYDNVYIVSFENVKEARYAYSYYVDKVDYIADMSNVFSLAEKTEENNNESSANDEETDPIENLNNMETQDFAGYIALIDSGADADASISVIGDDYTDNNGHGTKMLQYIKEENPDAKVLSIKAFDGFSANIADVYAAIRYAIDSNVSVINLSFVSFDNEQGAILKEVIQEALDKDIVVIGAAGNNADSSSKFIPGCIEGVITIGAVNENGTLYKTSNYDADLYVVATSTSEATARYSGIYTSKKESSKVYDEFKNAEDVVDINTADINEAVYTTDKSYAVKYLYVDKDMIGDYKTIDDVIYNCLDSVIYESIYYAPVYKQDNVYMFHADIPWKTGVTTGDALDYVFANANNYGEVIEDGVRFDAHNKIAYVNADAFENGEFGDGQLQILVPVDKELKTKTTIQYLNSKGDIIDEENLDSVWYAKTNIELNEEIIPYINEVYVNDAPITYNIENNMLMTNAKGIDLANVKIILNDDLFNNPVLAEMNMGTGSLSTDYTALTGTALYVNRTTFDKFHDIMWSDLGAICSQRAYVDSSNVRGDIDNVVYYGALGNYNGKVNVMINPFSDDDGYNMQGASVQDVAYYMGLHIGNFPGLYLDSALTQSLPAISGTGDSNIDGKFYQYFPAICIHIRGENNPTGVPIVRNVNMKVIAEFDGSEYAGYENDYRYKIIAIMSNSTIGGTSVSNVGQAGYTTFMIKVRDDAYMTLTKGSSNTTCTNGNDNYNLAGATFDVYTVNANGTKGSTKVGTFTTNSDGSCSPSTLNVGPYLGSTNNSSFWVEETNAPKGYLKDTNPQVVQVTSENTEDNPKKVEFKDQPIQDPISITLDKQSSTGFNYDNNSKQSLEGAIFTVKFYPIDASKTYSTTSVMGMTPTCTTTYKTIYNSSTHKYECKLDSAHKVGGDDPVTKVGAEINIANGEYQYPLGVLTIQETTPPAGYVLTGSEFKLGNTTVKYEDAEKGTVAVRLTENGEILAINGTNRLTNAVATIKEKPKMFGFTMTKHDADLNANETQGNATNLTATFKLINNEASQTLWADIDGDGVYDTGEAIAPGQEVKVTGRFPFKTSADGKYTSPSKLLQAGKWKIVEIEGPDGYLVSTDRNGNPVCEFDGMSVASGGTTRTVNDGEVININNIKAIKDPIKRGGFAMVKLDTEKLKSEPQGNGDLTATYEVVNNSANKVVVNGTTYDKGAVVYTFTTQKVTVGGKTYYEHHSSNVLLPYGSYIIREKTAGTGYFKDTTRGGQVTYSFTVSDEHNYHIFGPEDFVSYVKPLVKFDDGHGKDLNLYEEHSVQDDFWFTDTVKRGQVKIKKNDGDKKDHYSEPQGDYESRLAQGDATLQGATYDVINNSTYSIMIDTDNDGKYETEVKKGEVAITLTTDAEGYAETPEKYLPYGSYIIKETKAPEGYNLVDKRGVTVSSITDTIDDEDDVIDCNFRKVAKGDIENSNYKHTFYNDIIRAGVTIKKNDADRADHLSSKQGDYFLTKDYESRKEQGDASLEGATYDIINQSKSYVWVDTNNNGTFEDTEIYQPGDVVYTLTTDKNGYASTPNNTFLPYGTYDIVETEASNGYLNSTIRNGVTKQTVIVREEGKEYDLTFHPYDSTLSDDENSEQRDSDIDHTFFEPIMRAGFKFDKRDEETGKNEPLGSANLEGTYKVINLSASYVWVDVGNGKDNDGDGQIDHYGNPDGIYSDDEIFWPGEIIYTFKTDKKDGHYETPNNQYLPYGTYKIQEIDPPMGYLMLSDKNPSLSLTFEVREEDKQYDLTQKIYNYAVRGDLWFNKRDGNTSKVMAYIPFKITSLDQDGNEIESHIVYTDKNGYFNSSSSYVRHGWKTNAGDQGYADYMAYYEEHGVWPEDDGVVIEGTQGHSGTWFGVDTKPVQVEESYQDYIDAFNQNKEYPNDGSLDIKDSIRLEQTGAFPYGTYLIEELPCKSNEGFVMYKDSFVIDFESASDKTTAMDPHGWYAGRDSGCFDYGNIDNFDVPTIETIALAQDTESHMTPAYKDLVIIDDVSLHHLVKDTEYRLHTSLWVSNDATPEQVVDKDGKPVEVDKLIKPTSQEHFAKVNIEFDATLYKGKTITVYEELYDKDDNLIARHTDITDKEQQIYISDISTVLSKDGEHLLKAEKGITVTDKIKYVNFEPNKTFKVSDYLIDKDTLDYALDDNGNKIKAETTFTADESGSGEAEVEFTFDAETLEGKTLVAFAEATNDRRHNLVYYGEHMDIEDAEQTIKFPSVGTQAFDEETGIQMSFADDHITVVDTCEYKNVFAGLTLTMKGKLVDKATGEVLKVNGQEITAEKTFVAESENGTVDLTFTFDGSELKNTTLVAYETLFIASTTAEDGTFTVEREIADHSDINDAAETIYIPEIGTTASDSETGLNIAYADNDVTINDKVAYHNFMNGEFKFEGKVMDKATGNPVLDADGKEITSSVIATISDAEGVQDVEFKINAEALSGKQIVIFETAYYNNKTTAEDGTESDNFIKIAEHADINDAGQSITFPEIGTTAFDTDSKINITNAGQVSITDTVEYKGLLPNIECVLEGQLVNKETKEILTDAEGNVIKSEATFTPETADGKTEVKFEFDASQLAGSSYVVFEKLSVNGHVVAKHEDINSEAQTIHIPSIGTTLTEKNSKLHYANADGTIALDDVVAFKNLIPNHKFVMKGYLVNKADESVMTLVNNNTPKDESADQHTTNDATKDTTDKHTVSDATEDKSNNNTATDTDAIIEGTVSQDGNVVSVTFTPVSTDGYVNVPFMLEAAGLDGKTLVAYEELYVVDNDGREWLISEHKDINDEAQTVHVPKIGTVAVNANDNTHYAENGKVTIKDTVEFENLIPGIEVTFKGVMMSKDKKTPIKNADGNDVTAEVRYTPETANGSAELTFEFNSSDYSGDTAVAFEEVYVGSTLIGQHKDINDESQSVHIVSIKTSLVDTKTNIKTTADGKTILEDTVEYDGLTPGATYVMSGRIMDKATSSVLVKGGDSSVINTLIEGVTGKSNEYIAETTFTPEKSSGTVKLSFEVDTTDLDGKALVAFEKLYFENHEIAKHEDINDESQTVYVAKIGTTASSEDGKNVLKSGEKTTLKDVIAFENLTKDTEFTIKGEVYDKSTGKSTGIKAESKFTPKDSKGETTMNFTVDTTKYAGKELVVFEYIYYKDVLVASHTDINSKSQTVSVEKPKDETTTEKTTEPHTTTDATPNKDTSTKTNDILLVYILAAIIMAGAGGIAVYYGFKRRKIR